MNDWHMNPGYFGSLIRMSGLRIGPQGGSSAANTPVEPLHQEETILVPSPELTPDAQPAAESGGIAHSQADSCHADHPASHVFSDAASPPPPTGAPDFVEESSMPGFSADPFETSNVSIDRVGDIFVSLPPPVPHHPRPEAEKEKRAWTRATIMHPQKISPLVPGPAKASPTDQLTASLEPGARISQPRIESRLSVDDSFAREIEERSDWTEKRDPPVMPIEEPPSSAGPGPFHNGEAAQPPAQFSISIGTIQVTVEEPPTPPAAIAQPLFPARTARGESPTGRLLRNYIRIR